VGATPEVAGGERSQQRIVLVLGAATREVYIMADYATAKRDKLSREFRTVPRQQMLKQSLPTEYLRPIGLKLSQSLKQGQAHTARAADLSYALLMFPTIGAMSLGSGAPATHREHLAALSEAKRP
jgi:hypothetical protein